MQAERIHDPEKTERTELVFKGEALEALVEIARRENKRLDQVVEDALSLKKWTLEVKDDGDKIVVRSGNKDKYQLAL